MLMFSQFFGESQYVQKVRYYKPPIKLGKLISNYNEKEKVVFDKLLELKALVEGFDYLKKIYEVIYFELVDYENIKLLITLNEGKVTISDNFDVSIYPTSRLKVGMINIEHVIGYLQKGSLSGEELQRIFHYLAIPILDSFYHSKIINKLGSISFLKLHKLIHMEIINPNLYKFQDGKLIETKATVINVHGQFIILPGHHGVSPVLFEVNQEQALEYYFLLNQKFPQSSTLFEKRELYNQYLKLREYTIKINPNY
jgi:hypothetical protein